MRYSLLLAGAFLCAGCQVVQWTNPQLYTAREQVRSLTGTSWRAEMIGESAVSHAIESTLEVGVGARIAGHGGCSPYISELAVKSRSIRFAEIVAMPPNCESKSLEQERRFFSALNAARAILIQHDRLQFLDESGAAVLRLVRLPHLQSKRLDARAQFGSGSR